MQCDGLRGWADPVVPPQRLGAAVELGQRQVHLVGLAIAAHELAVQRLIARVQVQRPARHQYRGGVIAGGGVNYVDDVEPRTLLVYYLRERLGKTGTLVGCDTSNCGACTVHLLSLIHI